MQTYVRPNIRVFLFWISHIIHRGFNHISIFNKEILNPSKPILLIHPRLLCRKLMRLQSRREEPKKLGRQA